MGNGEHLCSPRVSNVPCFVSRYWHAAQTFMALTSRSCRCTSTKFLFSSPQSIPTPPSSSCCFLMHRDTWYLHRDSVKGTVLTIYPVYRLYLCDRTFFFLIIDRKVKINTFHCAYKSSVQFSSCFLRNGMCL